MSRELEAEGVEPVPFDHALLQEISQITEAKAEQVLEAQVGGRRCGWGFSSHRWVGGDVGGASPLTGGWAEMWVGLLSQVGGRRCGWGFSSHTVTLSYGHSCTEKCVKVPPVPNMGCPQYAQ